MRVRESSFSGNDPHTVFIVALESELLKSNTFFYPLKRVWSKGA